MYNRKIDCRSSNKHISLPDVVYAEGDARKVGVVAGARGLRMIVDPLGWSGLEL